MYADCAITRILFTLSRSHFLTADLNYRYAPATQRLGPNEERYYLTDERLKQIRSQFLYWFYDKGGDDDHGDYQIYVHHSNPQVHKNFNFQLPFFGFRFNYTRVIDRRQ